jgi:hypothetical protein
MQDAVVFALFALMLASIWGVIKPFGGLRRRWFAIGVPVFFLAAAIAAPKPTPEELAAKEKAEALAGSEQIMKKAEAAISQIAPYERNTHSKTYAKVGRAMFGRLTELEKGALLVAAESNKCDTVDFGGVSIDKSKKDAPVWYVDCKNGNRFLVDLPGAEAALERQAKLRLASAEREPDCTNRSLSLCDASKAQKAANESEVVTMCDLLIREAVISDADMDWGWNYAFSDGDRIQVVRGFKAQNAFGAELKHRYVCYFDAGIGRVTELSVEGPFGTKRLI